MLKHFFNNKAIKITKLQGFSLLELLAVVTILAIIIVAGMPVYKNYNLRSKTLTMLRMAEAAKLQVEQDYLRTGTLSSSYAFGAMSFTQISNSVISSITVSNSIITITGNSSGLNNNAIVLTLQPSKGVNNALTWKCLVNSSSYSNMVPDICQNTS